MDGGDLPGLSRRDFATTQPNAAIPGVTEVSMSCPYRHMPASRRRESRAARPAQRAAGFESRALAMDCASGADVVIFLQRSSVICSWVVEGGEEGQICA